MTIYKIIIIILITILVTITVELYPSPSKAVIGLNPISPMGIVVAGNNTSDDFKASANYICDGRNDEEEIQAAIDYDFLHGIGYQIFIMGKFYISHTINMKIPCKIYSSHSGGAILYLTRNANCDVIDITAQYNAFPRPYGWCPSLQCFDIESASQSNHNIAAVRTVSHSDGLDIEQLVVLQFDGDAYVFNNVHSLWATQICAEHCYGTGLTIDVGNGTELNMSQDTGVSSNPVEYITKNTVIDPYFCYCNKGMAIGNHSGCHYEIYGGLFSNMVGNAIEIKSNINITLDCVNFQSNGGYGVYFDGCKKSSMHDCLFKSNTKGKWVMKNGASVIIYNNIF